jgi:Flp pilus assembly protein TadG
MASRHDHSPIVDTARPPRPARFRPLVRDRRGVAAVEFALLGGAFFLIIFAIIETAFIFIGNVTLEQAVARAGRTVRTGYVTNQNVSEADFKKSICAEITMLLSCDEVKIDLRKYAGFDAVPSAAPVVGGSLSTSGFTFESGKGGDIMALRVFYEWPLFTNIVYAFLSDLGGGKHLLMSVAVFKNEPF